MHDNGGILYSSRCEKKVKNAKRYTVSSTLQFGRFYVQLYSL